MNQSQQVHRCQSEQERKVRVTLGHMKLSVDSCYFSAKVRKAIAVLKLKIELGDIMVNTKQGILLKHGGKTAVPCLYLRKPANGKTHGCVIR